VQEILEKSSVDVVLLHISGGFGEPEDVTIKPNVLADLIDQHIEHEAFLTNLRIRIVRNE
jgi:hypothetical protein